MVGENESEFTRLIYEKKGYVGWLTMNRPEARNGQGPLERAEMIRALESARDDDDVRVIVITGAGDAFCAGGDISNFPTGAVDFMERIGMQLKGKKRPVEMTREIPKPIIAMVNGLALGAGCELAMACDIIIASEKARFGQPEIRLGLIPGGGGTQMLPRLVGEKKAKELVFTGEMIKAEEALRIGLVNRVVPHERLREAVEEFAAGLCQKKPYNTEAGETGRQQGPGNLFIGGPCLRGRPLRALFLHRGSLRRGECLQREENPRI